MVVLQFSSLSLPFIQTTPKLYIISKSYKPISRNLNIRREITLNAVEIGSKSETSNPIQTEEQEEEPQGTPVIDIAFVHSRLLPDGSADVHYRSVCGGQKLRDIMLDTQINLYGPYDKPLSNCCGGGTCGTCIVEVVEGKELLSPKTDKEKEKLKRNPKSWRLACQTVVGEKDTRGELIIQQMPEYKAHHWQ